MKAIIRAVLAGALTIFPIYALACAGCGCTLSSDWESQGFTHRT